MSKLEGKVAVITGASKGIGAETAKELAAAGAAVIVNYSSDKEGADRVVAIIKQSGGKALAVQADVSKAEEVKRLFGVTKETFGRLDILVNNAGVYAFGAIEDFEDAEFHRQFNINVLGLLLATSEAVKLFGAEGGNIINISSAITSVLMPSTAIYSGTKGAVDAITGVLANELGSRNIRVNSINPGSVVTEGIQSIGILGTDAEKAFVAQTPLGRLGQPEDIAKVAVFLASDESRWLTGEKVIASGGMR